ncbi:MAG: hypothetical protein KGZ63_08995 [Clostridiales bacterium]|jgi:hypothetical protein|nr:hypothetical protein [Clostridiales bacterium]
MNCPICSSIDTGKVGTGQYYCWNCFVEFCVRSPDEFTAYYVDEEGTLVSLDEMAEAEAQAEEIIGLAE